MSEGSQERRDVSPLEAELYFLIARLLSSGPCVEAGQVLRRELEKHKLLPKRIDWNGQEHLRSFENLVETNRHISADHLLQICRRIGPVLDKEVKPSVRGVVSLLGAGRQSLLRTAEDVKHIKWPAVTHTITRHCRPLLPPPNLAHVPNFVNILKSREFAGVARYQESSPIRLFSKVSRHSRTLGHLSAVYCVTFDRTGKYIITGADDHLLKIWSALSGRLLATMRGHASEITDIAVNYDNRLLASGSCDKMVRVWCLKTLAPIAVLHGHQSMVTSLQFCPYSRGDTCFLLSTGADAAVCFWQWNSATVTFNPKPIKFIERSRAGAQMLCASFSPGGVFLATGSADYVIRVFAFTALVPEKICELDAHNDRVDSIQYANKEERFVSGSKDGTAKIWRFERQEWRCIVLNMSTKHASTVTTEQEDSKNKFRVTMVRWTLDDQHVITAVSDFSLKLWNSHTGQLVHVLQGHQDEVFVIEHHPLDARIVLSAGHDGNIILWDISTGTMIKSFFNMIEGQGHGAVFDCKWSPDGQTFAATDSHGFLLIFGTGTNEKYKRIPEEQFFHTDYRPLIRDANHYVLDEQTQQPPHLMPPPFLVDVDGNPHPPRYQRLVPGRESCNGNQLVPQIGTTPSGDREVLDQPLLSPSREDRVGIDQMIERMRQEQDERFATERNAPVLSPRALSRQQSTGQGPSARGPRRSGETEGVRQSEGNVPVSQRATQRDIAAWRRRVVVRELHQAQVRHEEELRHCFAEDEIKRFVLEKKRKPLLPSEQESSDSGSYIRTRRRKRPNHTYRTRATNNHEETSRNRLATRALYDTEEEEEAADEEMSAVESEQDQAWNSDSSREGGASSDEYSDWTPDAGENLQPPKRSQRKPKRRKLTSSEEEPDDDEEVENQREQETRSSPKPKKKPPSKKKKPPQKPLSPSEVTELAPEFIPPEWLTASIPRKAPYVPQMGDEVIYFRQGHELYVNAVKRTKAYDINPNKNQPWHKISNLREQELVKIVGIKYEIKPPRLVCLKLAFIDPETGKMTGGSFSIKYHDMPDVIDFLVLRQMYDNAMSHKWKIGNRFRSMIDDAWWMGKIASQESFQPEFPDSMFQCFNVVWDNGEAEKMSPWDLEPINRSRMPSNVGGGVTVSAEELKSLLYSPREGEWPEHSRDAECDRIIQGLQQIFELSMAEPFLVPVELNRYPLYAMVVEYPIDLTTIKSRLENRFYRRISSVLYDVRYIETNAQKFNEPGSVIVKYAKIITELCMRLINEVDCHDVMLVYSELTKDADFAVEVEGSSTEEYEENENGEGPSSGKRKKSQSGKSAKRSRANSDVYDSNAWRDQCRELLHTMITCEDSEPFRQAVDPLDYPDYYEIVDCPMDLSLMQEQMECGNYTDPAEFSKDVRLIFKNSRAYNTNKRSRIYAMTLRLSAMFEDQISDILDNWKKAVKHEKSDKLPSKQSKVTSPATHSGPSTSTSRNVNEPSTSSSSLAKTARTAASTFRTRTPKQSVARPSQRSTNKRTRNQSNEGDSESDESGSESGSGDGTDSGSEIEEEEVTPPKRSSRLAVKKSTAKKKPSPTDKRAVPNGHRLYATRNTTGSRKRKNYADDDSEDNSKNDSSGSSSDSSSSGDTDSSSSSTSSSGKTDSSSDSEADSKTSPKGRSARARQSSSKRSPRKNSSRKKTSQREPKRRALNGDFHDDDDDDDDGGGGGRRSGRSARRTTRNQGRQTVKYREDSDFEYYDHSDASEASGSSLRNSSSVAVSSRGRVRKLTPRARASLLGE